MDYIKQLTESDSTHSLSNKANFYSHSYKTGSPKKESIPPGTVSFGQHTLPRKTFSKRSGSASSHRKTAGTSDAYSLKKRMSYYDNVSKPIFVAKCLCMITRIPIVYSSENFLRFLWALIQDKKMLKDEDSLPIESFIYWILHEVFIPRVFLIILGTFAFNWYFITNYFKITLYFNN